MGEADGRRKPHRAVRAGQDVLDGVRFLPVRHVDRLPGAAVIDGRTIPGAGPEKAPRVDGEGLRGDLGKALLGAEEAERRAAFGAAGDVGKAGDVGNTGGEGGSRGERAQSRSRKEAEKNPAQGRIAPRGRIHSEIKVAPLWESFIESVNPFRIVEASTLPAFRDDSLRCRRHRTPGRRSHSGALEPPRRPTGGRVPTARLRAGPLSTGAPNKVPTGKTC
jgi:hypothetical protein